MTATSVAPTTSMAAKALCLVADQSSWSRGTSKRTGESFWVIPGSKPNTAHYTTSAGCTCKSFETRGVCSHIEAVRVAEAIEDERTTLGTQADETLLTQLLAEQAARARTLRLLGFENEDLGLMADPTYADRATWIARLQARIASN